MAYDHYNDRVMGMLKHSGGRPMFNVDMPRLPSYKKITKSYMRRQNFNIPDAGKVMNIVMIGGIGLAAYFLYNKFISPLMSSSAIDAANNAQMDKNGLLVVSQQKDSITQTAASVANVAQAKSLEGLVKTQSHADIANWFYGCLNVEFSASNQDGIIKQLSLPNGMSDQTFLLVYNEFGIRDFPCNFLSYDEVQLRTGFFDTHWKGSLIDGLKHKMSASNYAKINARISNLLKLIPA